MDTQRVLLPLRPGSGTAQRALPAAAAAARAFDCGLEILVCVDDEHEVSFQRGDLEAVKRDIRRRDPGVDLRVSVIVEPHAPEGIVEAAAAGHLPVLATSATIFKLDHYLGSAAEIVVRLSGRPALLVGPDADRERALDVDSVVVPVDGSDLSEAAIPVGAHWAATLDVPLWLVSVLPPESGRGGPDGDGPLESSYVRGVAQRHRDLGVDLQWEVLHDTHVADALVRHATTGLLVMSTHGRTGLARVALGSVATDVVRHAARAVVVVRPDLPDG